MRFEEQYMDVLQNIESGIMIVYRKHPEIADYSVMRVIEALIEDYKAVRNKREPKPHNLSEPETLMLKTVGRMCDWRIGRQSPDAQDAEDLDSEEPPPGDVTVDEMILCLRRILTSAKLWNRNNGRQGYLNFVSKYVR